MPSVLRRPRIAAPARYSNLPSQSLDRLDRYTDPQTCDLFELAGINVRGMTYNEMCELEGSMAFGD